MLCTSRTIARMALTVRDLARSARAAAAMLAGGQEGDRPALRWVHGSELEDPTPWLKGGEVLLTTGMGVGAPLPSSGPT